MKLVVIGAQWGDEGKAKTVDYLAQKADIVARFSGGANAGHTIVADGKTYKLHLIPSGIVLRDKKVLLGIGMVIDLQSLFQELSNLEEQGLDWKGRVFIADRAHIVLPAYKAMDLEMEKDRIRPIGTTGRGIGIAYAQKAHRDGIRIIDLFDAGCWARLPAEWRDYLAPFKQKIKPMIVDGVKFARENKDRNILLEGAQGALLDLDMGTYPFVSSGSSNATGAAIGSGFGPRHLDKVLGVFKAYSTRVGNGPFPSEFKKERDGNLEEWVRETGHEYGVTTGRARRCGYLDLVALRYTCWVNSMDALVLTHIDVYDKLETVQVCVGYDLGGEEVKDFPASIQSLDQAKPILKSFPGWQRDLTSMRSYEELPQEAKDYIAFIEEYCETPVDIVSVGPDREQTFERVLAWTV
jgi:adenylosuccinate synthase